MAKQLDCQKCGCVSFVESGDTCPVCFQVEDPLDHMIRIEKINGINVAVMDRLIDKIFKRDRR